MADQLAPPCRALADEHRRAPLDARRERDGRSLSGPGVVVPDMTRSGVVKHLRVLEEAGLVVTGRDGRSKRHVLDPVPIRELHHRWISCDTEPLAASIDLRGRAEGA